LRRPLALGSWLLALSDNFLSQSARFPLFTGVDLMPNPATTSRLFPAVNGMVVPFFVGIRPVAVPVGPSLNPLWISLVSGLISALEVSFFGLPAISLCKNAVKKVNIPQHSPFSMVI
jgi:hypothetical protein